MHFFFIYLAFMSSSNAFLELKNCVPLKSETLSFQKVQILSNIVCPLKHLQLQLNSINDGSNPYMKFFLEQQFCSISMSDNLKIKLNNNFENLVFLTDGLSFRNSLKEVPVNYRVIFAIISNSTKDDLNQFESEIRNELQTQKRMYQIYLLTTIGIHLYDPFFLSVKNSKSTYGKLINGDEKNSKNLFTNLNKFPLKFQIFRSVYAQLVLNEKTGQLENVKGPDGDVTFLLAKLMNFTLILQDPDKDYFGYRLENGSFVGAIGQIVHREADASFTGFFVKDYLTREIEFTVTVYTDDLCCYVPKASRIPQSILPLFSVRFEIWAGFISAGFLSAFIWMIIRKLNILTLTLNSEIVCKLDNYYVQGFSQYIRILLDTWVVWVRVNINKFPPFLSERVLVLSLCLISVIFGAIFESSLAMVYIRPLYYKDINTLSELDKSGKLIIYKHAAMKDDVFAGSSQTFHNLQKKMFLATDSKTPLIEKMSKIGGFASVTRSSSLYLDDIAYFLTHKIHKIPECPRRYQISYILNKNSPYTSPINDWLLQFLSAGLIDHWIDLTLYEAKVIATKNIQFGLTNNFKVLTLRDLQLAFYVISIGSSLAILALLAEIFLHKIALHM